MARGPGAEIGGRRSASAGTKICMPSVPLNVNKREQPERHAQRARFGDVIANGRGAANWVVMRTGFLKAVRRDVARLAAYSMTALWSTAAGAAGLRRSSTSGITASDRIISSLKSSV